MITEDYVSFELAQLLKIKGFNEDCRDSYDWGGNFHLNASSNNGSIKKIAAPTLQTAMKWLREVHNIFIEISTSIDLNGKYHFSYTILDKECKYIRRGYTDFDWDYEKAVEAAIKYSLENLI